MRQFNNIEAVALSGLSRGQIDQLIARWGVGLYGKPGLFRTRGFNATDMFNIMLAGQLHHLGLSMPAIRDVILCRLGLYAWDAETDAPAEVYPGQLEAGPGRHLLGIFNWRGQWSCRLYRAGEFERIGPTGTVSIVIDATGLVERIKEAATAEIAA